MAHEATVIVGSGLNPSKKALPINVTDGETHLRGTQTIVVNPEDASAGRAGMVTAVTVSGTVVQIPPTPLNYRRGIAISNNSNSHTLYVGFDSGVTTANGYPVGPGTSLPMDINCDIKLYGVAQAGHTLDVRILEVS